MDTMTLGGREYRPLLQSTIEHDFWVMSQIRSAGLDKVAIGADESPEDFAQRFLDMIVRSKQVFPLLGGMLIPAELQDLDWTTDTAESTAQALRNVTDQAEKQILISEVAALTASFFAGGLTSLRTFRTSSGAGAESPQIVEPSTAESGPAWSVPSADTTSTDTQSPGGGPSARPSSRWSFSRGNRP